MEALLEIILRFYRIAHEARADEFQARALSQLRTVLPFDSAMWHTATNTTAGIVAIASTLYDHAEAGLAELVDVNRRHPIVIDVVFAKPRRAHRFYGPATYPRADQADVRDYQQRYGHQNAMLIVDSATPHAIGEALPLYRADDDDHFSDQDQKLLETLFPHMVEALAINRQLAFGRVFGQELGDGTANPAGSRALARPNGLLITCGARFAQMLRRQWPHWRESWLPPQLLQALRCSCGSVSIANGDINISFQRMGELIFLSATERLRIAVLSQRELQIARLFANGHSHQHIATELELSPTTIRNALQRSYRKLQINDRTELVRMVGQPR